MQRDDFLLVLAVVLVGLSLFGLIVTLSKFTGYSTIETGTANLSVESQTNINFSIASINWGAGRVTQGQTFATLDSEGTVTATP